MTWDFAYGDPFTIEIEDKIIDSLRPSYIEGLTILGGEPMEPANQKVLAPFIEKIKNGLPDKSIWVYSGYTYEELTDVKNTRCHSEDTNKILDMIDVLVDGEFMIDKKDISLRFRGSSNQRIIDVPKSVKASKIILIK